MYWVFLDSEFLYKESLEINLLLLFLFSEPVSMASVIGVVIGLLVLFVILVIVLLYAYKKQKLCFKGNILYSLYYRTFVL